MRDSYVIAKYIRLSDADGDLSAENGKDESNSISNQRELLQRYIDAHPEFGGATVIEFCDDGRTGTNFDRPGVQKMLEQAKQGRINCIIVKDLSRFGRDYIEVGDYLEQIFPFLGVRFIAINDDYDSIQYKYGSAGLIDVSFKNVIYDLYSKDLSRKVRGTKAQLAKKGYNIAPYAFFGYRKSDADRHQLVIDEEAAEIVRNVFDRFLQGQTAIEIAQAMNHSEISTPLMLKRSRNVTRKWNCVDQNQNMWTATMVRKMLNDERYTGKEIFGKTQRKQVGKPRHARMPKEEWIVVENAFEAIISQETFDLVQAKIPIGFSATGPIKSKHVFYRKVKCGNCRLAMTRTKGKHPAYACNTHRNKPDIGCSAYQMDEKELSQIVLAAIRKQAQLMQKITQSVSKENQVTQRSNLSLIEQIEKCKASITKHKHDKMQAFEDMSAGHISDKEYMRKCTLCNEHIEDTELKIAQIEASLKKVEVDGVESLSKSLLPYTNVRTLTRELVDELISAIYIYNSQAVEIVWTFQDEYKELIDRLIKKNAEK